MHSAETSMINEERGKWKLVTMPDTTRNGWPG